MTIERAVYFILLAFWLGGGIATAMTLLLRPKDRRIAREALYVVALIWCCLFPVLPIIVYFTERDKEDDSEE